ncbi:MAG: response regulator, partial [Clostridia bacterium]|nr:response regulator [Clostridia bacterium]
ILMSVAIFTLLMSVVKQYSPINSLAREMKTQIGASTDGSLIDEKSLLTDSFAVLKGDSELKQRFEAAYHEADAANKAKSAFLSNMSHDIRTPMNAIVGMTELAAKHTNDPTYVKECLQSVSVASQYLLDIINNVLDMSRIESGQFSLSEDEIDLVKLVHGMMTILNHNIEVKSQKLIVTVDDVEDEHMIGDNIRLTQVLMNILSNAVKFTPNGGTIRLQIRQKKSLEPEYGEYEFVISDTGIGMTKEFVQKVFDTFTRDENVGISRIEGTGLGMAIAKNLIDLMGGTINCESELGQGTTFTVTIRMKLTNTQAADTQKTDGKIAAELSNKEMSENIQVLILGNEAEECENQVIQFKRAGASAEYAQSVTAALTMIQKKKEMQSIYDFVIINQTEHDQSGIIAVSQMSKELPISQTTYVFAAGDTFSVENSKAFNAGISIFVQRPLFKSTVTGIINRTIQLADHLQETNIVNLEGKNILLVEDNEINRQIAAAILSETHADIYEATNGKEAVEAFKSHESGFFDMILMDVQMPKMNGYDATIAIRSIQREDALSVPIYAMTANTYDEDVRQVKAVGMDGHIGKPYSSNDLYAILKQAILPEVKP